MPTGDKTTSAMAAAAGAASKGKVHAKAEDWTNEDGLLTLRGLARDGLTNEQIAEALHGHIPSMGATDPISASKPISHLRKPLLS